MSPGRLSGSPLVFTSRWPPAAEAPARAEASGPITAILGWLRLWRERERHRRELSLLSGRDFGDLAVPPSLIAEELHRWPWQKPSPQWRAIDDRQRGGR